MISSSQLRERFLDYFGQRGHSVVPSSPLIPANDPTLLFTNAGMVQFKELFLGREERGYRRAVSSQRCVRAGGKHNDLENVGYTARHHTFFEMLGNFSFGDYFKREAIGYAWELLTRELEIPAERLWVTVFTEDDEAADIWLKEIGVSPERFSRIGAKDNFWSMGDTGPCGPCTEIFYDHGPEIPGGPPGTPDDHLDRYVEIWNLVFMQYDRAKDGTLTPLPKPSVDTGMGLERLAAVLQGVHNNYDIDLFQRLISGAAQLTATDDLGNSSLKVIADHIRSCAFLILDGVMPSNEGRGYVLRRIIRRAARHGHKLGQQAPFFHQLADTLAAEMGEAYPELVSSRDQLVRILRLEEEQFAKTLDQGLHILEQDIARLGGNTLLGETIFKLYDTYGFPVDLTADIVRERGLELDMTGFEREMEAQRARARAAGQFTIDHGRSLRVDIQSRFLGYDRLAETGRIEALLRDGQPVERLDAGEEGWIILNQTPFYAESGGQVGDTGLLSGGAGAFEVLDTQKQGDAIIHVGRVNSGQLASGEEVSARVDEARRRSTVLNHSATHLLHAALRQVLGSHVQQKGSLVTPERLRFDFSHFEPVSAQQLREIERLVNDQVLANIAAQKQEMSMDEALAAGALAFFGDKYGERVRVVSMGPFSVELCGGTHVERTGDIGLVRIVAESGIASGVRRIEAVTGRNAIAWVEASEQLLQRMAERLKSGREEVEERLGALLDKGRKMEKELEQLKGQLARQAGDDLLNQAVEVAGIKVLAAQLHDVDNKALRDTLDQLKSKLESAAILLATVQGEKVRLIAGVTKGQSDKVPAGELVNYVAQQVGGKGGGRPDMAQAGGTQPEHLKTALGSIPAWIEQRLTR